jgi:hypothetical protein
MVVCIGQLLIVILQLLMVILQLLMVAVVAAAEITIMGLAAAPA